MKEQNKFGLVRAPTSNQKQLDGAEGLTKARSEAGIASLWDVAWVPSGARCYVMR